ncbi:MAG: MYXO-CTERM sorting domain-containing protein [Myxococcota bacterium]
MLLVLGWLGCGRSPVVYDSVGTGDAIDDLVYATLLFGRAESDEDQILGPHAAGSVLTINARRKRSVGGLRWFATTLNPEIAQVVAADTSTAGLTLTLSFVRPGTTDLYILDQDGVVLDVQPLRVREAVEAGLVPWDDLAAGSDTPLDGPVHLVGGTTTSLAVTWRDSAGVPLDGGDLLVVDGAAATAGVVVYSEFTGGVDVVTIEVDAGAPAGTFPIAVGSDTFEVEHDIVVHTRAEVDRLSLVQVPSADGEGGLVLAELDAGGDRLVGAAVVFRFDGEEHLATGFTWEPGPTTTVEACFDAVPCQTVVLAGKPVTFTDAEADPGACGCSGAPASAGWLVVGLAAAVRRRRGHPRNG